MSFLHDSSARSPDLAGLLGSRICHDLISPLGAISNGVELLEMAGIAPGPEMQLIAESIANANAKIRFFRVAFGASCREHRLSRTEIDMLLGHGFQGSRLQIDWQPEEDAARSFVKLSFLTLLCMESAMPWGGRITVRQDGARWHLRGEASRIRLNSTHWAQLSPAGDIPADMVATEVVPGEEALAPAHVQFALLPEECRGLGRRLELRLEDGVIGIGF